MVERGERVDSGESGGERVESMDGEREEGLVLSWACCPRRRFMIGPSERLVLRLRLDQHERHARSAAR